jgi:hypothetical protein
MRDFQAEYDRITRMAYRLRNHGPLPMELIEMLDTAQHIIRLESRLAGREVR